MIGERPARCYSAGRMHSIRLYFDDPALAEFEAVVVARASHEGRPSLILDRTAFYPESGGQMADRGTLCGRAVIDVQIDDEGRVHHVVDESAGELPEIGQRVSGAIDRVRRRVHRALHTGQHILSRALVEVAQAETVSSRLGETACTIDVDQAGLTEAAVARAVDLANSVIDDDVVVRAFFPGPDELRALPLRRAPKVTDAVRVVTIGDFDVTPCGGTHCTQSAQVGVVHVSGVERYKGGTRLRFSAGARARDELGRDAALLRTLAKQLTCGPSEVAGKFEKLRNELGETRTLLGHTRARIAERQADEILEAARASGERTLIACFEGASVELLRAIGTRLSALPEAVALLAGNGSDGTQVLAVRGSASSFDCGSFVKRAAAEAGGRGGGRPERAEGRLPAGIDWEALARRVLET